MTLALNDPAGPATFIMTLEDLRQPGRRRVVKLDSEDWLRHFADHPEQRPFLLGAIHRMWRAAGYQIINMAVVSSGVFHYNLNLATYKLESLYAAQSYAYSLEDSRAEQREWRDNVA